MHHVHAMLSPACYFDPNELVLVGITYYEPRTGNGFGSLGLLISRTLIRAEK